MATKKEVDALNMKIRVLEDLITDQEKIIKQKEKFIERQDLQLIQLDS